MGRNILGIAAFLGMTVILLLVAFEKPVLPEKKSAGRIAIFCAPSFDPAKMKEKGAPLFKGLGNLHYAVTTRSKLAQKYFDQGLTLVYAFNHGEAGRSFNEVIRLDSACAMAYWGLGMVLGPNYNAGLDPAVLKDINEVMDKAVKYSANASPKEKALIRALAKRFPESPVDDMTPYNAAYATAMKEACEQFPNDVDIAVLYADALMNEHPWNLWLTDGSPQPWTPPIQQLLEDILAKTPDHAGAIHLYLHAMEASREVARAVPHADRLRDLLPSAGHLVHMPSHIYIHTGHYHKGVIANEKASAVDSTYIAQCKTQGFYPMLLYPHNIHFLAVSAFFEGSSKKAIDAAWMVARKADRKYLHSNATLQHYYSIPYYVLTHLGKWDDILKLPAPGESLQYPRAMWHFARGMALASKGQLQQAGEELKIVQQYAADQSLGSVRVWDVNSVLELINIAALSLESDIAMYNGQYANAIALLQKAVAIEDKLTYQEPPDWFFSVRRSLGHVLVQAGRFAEAEQVYLTDLQNYTENGWSLMGLYNSLSGQGKTAEAAAVKKRFDKAWQWADFKLTTSRIF